MRHCLLLLLALTAACSKGPQADLQYIAEARSLGAEWALVNSEAEKGNVTDAYLAAMRSSLQQQAKSAASAVTQPDTDYAREMQALAQEPADAAPATLHAHSDALKRIEDSLESA